MFSEVLNSRASERPVSPAARLRLISAAWASVSFARGAPPRQGTSGMPLYRGAKLSVLNPPVAGTSEPPEFVAVATAAGAASAANVTKPAVEVGDVMLMAGIVGNDSASMAITTGATWTQVPGSAVVATGMSASCWYRVIDGSEGSSFLFRDENNGGGGARATLVVYRGVDQGTPVGDSAQATIDPGNASYASGNVTPAAANSMLVQFCLGTVGTSWTPSTGFTERDDTGTTLAVEVADLAVEATDPVGATATASGAAVGFTYLIALTPA